MDRHVAGEKIRLLLIEDVPQVASHVRSLLIAQTQIQVVEVITDGDRALAAVGDFRPDIVIIDWLLQGRVSGAKAASSIRQAHPEVGIIVITVPQEPITEDPARGIDTVLRMPLAGFDLTAAIRRTAEERVQSTGSGGAQIVSLFSPKGGVGRTTLAYNLAVVVDDHFQGVTEIVRGADLVEPTVRQISLYHQFGWTAPDYIHLPLAVNTQGLKLSKQNHAPALPDGDPRPVLIDALRFLNQNVTNEWQDLRIDELLKMAIANWTLRAVPKIQHSQMRCAEL